MYAYVRNNPLAHIDSDWRVCSSLIRNTGSGYCQRADLYINYDALVQDKTRFFAAASAATRQIANVAVPGLGGFAASSETRAFLATTNAALESVNTEAVGQILSGQMSGSPEAIDRAMVHKEQNEVQKQLDGLRKADSKAYGAAINEINGLLNSKGGAVPSGLAFVGRTAFGTDAAYAQFVGGVQKSLGHDINFANQKDREAIGNGLVKHVRQTGGCDVAGDGVKGCAQ
jgi:hypothetical protein